MSQLAPTTRASVRVAAAEREQVRSIVLSCTDAAVKATERERSYNSREELRDAEKDIHQATLNLGHGLYGALLYVPGVDDHTTRLGLHALPAPKLLGIRSSGHLKVTRGPTCSADA